MNDFDTQHGATPAFGDDATDAYTADQATASSEMIDLTDQDAAARARVMRANLDQFDLDEEDLALLSGEVEVDDFGNVAAGLPVLAVVGRPNVGKSTLVNRILGRREAVVQDTPGVTRDRVSYPAEWAGRDFTLVDTGGWEIDVKGLDRSVAEQAEIAVDLADAVVLVLDATVGVTASDERIVDMLRSKEKPIILAANKVDSPVQEADAAYLWSLGLGEPYPISALHGRGTGDLLDVVMDVLPTESAVASALPSGGPRRVALVGRPNVGKSSLLNALAGARRVVVNELAGTTRDPVDELIELDGRSWWFVDTAGIRRKMHRTTGQVIDAGRALVIVTNKWDLVDEERQKEIKNEFEHELVQIQWAPRINLAAKTGWHTNRIVRALDTALAGWQTRIPTGQLNAFLGQLVAAHPHPLRGGKQPRILFGTQASSKPPRFVLFTTGFLDPGYRRFIERRLRETFGFSGTPIQISVRVREKRRR